MANNLKTTALLSILFVGVWWLGIWLFQGSGYGFWWGLALSGGMVLVSYFLSDKLALRAARAIPVTEAEMPVVYSAVRRLTLQAKMPMPAIYRIPAQQPNAFATGRSPRHAAVAVTDGIVSMLSQEELEGVLGHELAHVRNRDILISSVAAFLAAALTMFARWAIWIGGGDRDRSPLGAILGLLTLILAPIAALLIRLAISRSREFGADADGTVLTGQPLQLASALEKIDYAARRIPMPVDPSHANLFIENPLKGLRGRGGLTQLLSTHPPTEERVRRLHELAYGRR